MHKFIDILLYRMRVLALLAAFAPVMAQAGAFEDFFNAVNNDNATAMSDLLRRGVDPNMVEAERGETGLIIALRGGAMRVFNVLVNAPGIDLEAQARNGDNALMIAAYKGNRKAAEALLAKGAKVNRPGWTPLHYAAASGSNEIAKMLIDKGAILNAPAPNYTTPLMMAAGEGHIMTVKLLLDSGAELRLRNELGMNAIDFAARNGHKDIVEGLNWRLQRLEKK